MIAAIPAALIPLIPAAEAAAAVPAGGSVFDKVFPVTMLLILGLLLPAALLGINAILSRFAHGTRNTNPAKEQPYESGLPATVGTAGSVGARFFVVTASARRRLDLMCGSAEAKVDMNALVSLPSSAVIAGPVPL